MWICDKEKLKVSDKGAAFIACRWHELFDENTPDTFHPKLCHLASLVQEAVKIAELVEDASIWMKHLRLLIEEIKDSINRGVEYGYLTDRHKRLFERFLSAKEAPKEIITYGRLLLLDGLDNKIRDGLINEISALTSKLVLKKKSKTDKLLALFATYCYRRGYSGGGFSDLDCLVEEEFESILAKILNCLPAEKKAFTCVVAVKCENSAMARQMRDLLKHNNLDSVKGRVLREKRATDKLYVKCTREGYCASQVMMQVKKLIRDCLNVAALYNHTSVPIIEGNGWICNVEGNKYLRCEDPKNLFYNLHPRSNSANLSTRAVKSLLRKDEPAIKSALDMHNLALSTADDRLRLVNLWSALECLASTTVSDSVIGRVEKLVVPILTWRKIDKLVRYLSISYHYWLKNDNGEDFTDVPFGLLPEYTVLPQKLIKVLTDECNGDDISALIEISSGHPLLLYRTHEAWKDFSDPGELSKNLELSEKRLKWHLWRIYRARNLMVHQGVEVECLPQLANNLQQYVSWTLSRILHGLKMGDDWTAVDAANYWITKAEYVFVALKDKPELIDTAELFPECEPNDEGPVWQKVIKTGETGETGDVDQDKGAKSGD